MREVANGTLPVFFFLHYQIHWDLQKKDKIPLCVTKVTVCFLLRYYFCPKIIQILNSIRMNQKTKKWI